MNWQGAMALTRIPRSAHSKRQLLGHGVHPAFARAISIGATAHAHHAGDRREIDDHAATFLQHDARGRLATQKRAAQVDVQYAIPGFQRSRFRGIVLRNTRTIHQDVDTAKFAGLWRPPWR